MIPWSTWSKLSTRESEVLELFDQGLAYKEVASRLGLSLGTVLEYRERIVEKSPAAGGGRLNMRAIARRRREAREWVSG